MSDTPHHSEPHLIIVNGLRCNFGLILFVMSKMTCIYFSDWNLYSLSSYNCIQDANDDFSAQED